MRQLALCLLLVTVGCSDKSKEAGDSKTEPINRVLLADDEAETAEPYELPREFERWMRGETPYDATKCKDPTPQADPYVQCVVDFASKRCTKSDWCLIDCLERDFGKHAGGGCSHLCINRDQSQLFDDLIRACPLDE